MRALLWALVLGLPQGALATGYRDASSIVSIGGPVTEIVYALGAGDRVVARDTTSQFPEAVQALPDVGYMRQLSAEGVLSVGPDLILTRDTAGPPEVLDQLRASNIPVVGVHDGFTKEAVLAAVDTVGGAIGALEAAAALRTRIEGQFAALEQRIGEQSAPPQVLFILSNQAGRLNVAGRGTGADGIISLAGGVNVMSEAYAGYKIMNAEALIAAAPEVVVMMHNEEEHQGRADEVFALPALALTPAARAGAFVTVDPAALGFGPRTAEFALALHHALDAAAKNARSRPPAEAQKE